MPEPLELLQRRLQHQFKDPRVLLRALTHRSHGAEHNERLEFLGDAVLNLAVSKLLYERLGSLPEGDLSRVRAGLVRQESLHRIAQELGLQGLLRLGEGEARSGGQRRPSILADALEALIGAVCIDAGYPVAEALVQRLYDSVEIHPQMAAMAKDAKTELQEWLQARRIAVPAYRIPATRGQAHAQTFEVECAVPALGLAEQGEGRSRRTAEQEAARRLLDLLKASDKPGGPLRA